MLDIYVATSQLNVEWAKGIIYLLRQRGHRITVDWTEFEPHMSEANIAQQCAYGVKVCDALVLLYNHVAHENGRGLFVELGMAINGNKPVVCLKSPDSQMRDNTFLNHPGVFTVYDLEGLNMVLNHLASQKGTDAGE